MLSRRQFARVVSAGLAGAASPALPAVAATLVTGARPSDVRFVVMRGRSKIGVHTVEFRDRPDGLAVHTVIDLAVKVVFITVFRYQHECQDVWVSGQLVSLRSRTIEDGKRYAVEATAERAGIRVVGPGGPLVEQPLEPPAGRPAAAHRRAAWRGDRPRRPPARHGVARARRHGAGRHRPLPDSHAPLRRSALVR